MMWCKGNPNLNVFDSSSNCVSAVRRANVTSMKLGNSEDKPNVYVLTIYQESRMQSRLHPVTPFRSKDSI